MNEPITKSDLTSAINKHELDAAKRQKEISDKEQTLRHDQGGRFQNIVTSMDEKSDRIYDKVESNDKELALLKQSHNTMTEKVQEIKKEMKDGFSHIEHKLEDFLGSINESYATKSDHENSSKRIANLEKGIWGVISIVGVAIIGAVINLIIK